MASKALIPGNERANADIERDPTPQKAHALADRLNTHPAMVAGRIRHEQNNCRLLSRLLGQGEPGRQFVWLPTEPSLSKKRLGHDRGGARDSESVWAPVRHNRTADNREAGTVERPVRIANPRVHDCRRLLSLPRRVVIERFIGLTCINPYFIVRRHGRSRRHQ